MQVRKIAAKDLRTLDNTDWVDPERSPYVEGDLAWVPVRPGAPYDEEIPDRAPYRGIGYYMMGNVAVVHGDRPADAALQELIRFRHPQGVVWIEALEDITRTPRAALIWGTAGEVCHRESGITYYLDPEKVMFSPGNRNEKTRIADLVRRGPGGERVADMFAGIGYFTLPVARAGAQVHAMEINPVACGYLERNIRANGLEDRVTATQGDCRGSLQGTYDRILMGHFDAIAMLPAALTHVRPGSILHVHTIGAATGVIREAVEGAGFSATIQVHKVKKYRPHRWHMVQDVVIE